MSQQDTQPKPKVRWNFRGGLVDYTVENELNLDVEVGRVRITLAGYVLGIPEAVEIEVWHNFQPGKSLAGKPEKVQIPKGGGWKMSRGSAVTIRLSTGILGISWAWSETEQS